MAVPFDVEVSLALGADITADPSTWSWTDITDYAMVREGGVTIHRGRSDWQSQAQPSWCTVLLNNEDGRFSRLNPLGAYYGQLSKNTPLRVRACATGGSLVTRFVGFVSEWPPRWTHGETHKYVPVRADGVLRRLGQGATPLKSALRRAILSPAEPTPVAYWPCEDETGATSVASELPSGSPMQGSPLFSSGIDGSSGALDLGAMATAGESMRVSVPLPSASGFQLEWAVLATDPAGSFTLAVTSGTMGVGITFAPTLADGEPHHLAVKFEQNGADVDITSYRDGVFSSTTTQSSATLTASVDIRETGFATECLLAHLAVYGFADMDVPVDRAPAVDGFAGELAGVRFARLCTEESIAYDVAGTDVDTYAMGPQTVATLLNLVRECEAVSEGLLIERRTGELGLDLLSARENLTVALALDYDLGHIVDIAPADDDRLTRNDVTVTRTDGSSARAEQDTGPMSTDPEPGAGRYELAVSRNLYLDTQLPDHAGWLLDLGTVNEYRYPQVALKLHKPIMSSLIVDWLACDIGSRITIDNMPTDVTFDLVDQIPEGYTERIDSVSWDVTANLSPYKPYKVFELADTSADASEFVGRLAGDPDCALRTAVDDNDLSFPFDPNFYRWTLTADDFDPDPEVRLSGEVVAVSTISTTAATFVAAGTADHDDNVAVTPADYAGGAVDDWVCVVAGSRDTTTPTLAITDPNYTYTQMGQQGGLYFWAAVRTASTPAPTITPTGGAAGDTVSAFTFGLRGMPTTLTSLTQAIVLRHTVTNSSAQNIAYHGIYPWLTVDGRPPTEGAIVLLLARKSDDWTSVAVPSGFTEIAEPSSLTGNDQGLYAAYQIQTTAAAISAGSLVVTGGAGAVSESMTIALVGGYQTATVSARSVNGVVKSHPAGTPIAVEAPLVLGL